MTKRMARITSVALAILLMFSLVCVAFTSANAADEGVSPYLIDTTRKASLTLYKYEMPDVTAASTAATGEMDDSVNVPEGAKLLPGVTFTVYQLDNSITPYTDGSGKKVPEAKDAPSLITADTVKYVGVTGNDGKVTFSDLDLGVYYVEETDGPANITKRVAPFVITLPLTDKASTKWLYDVYAFPKNETAYGNVDVLKIDSKTEEALPGAEFTLYQQKGEEWVEYLTGITTGEDGKAAVLALPAQMNYKFVETKTSDESYILDSTIGYEFYVDATGDAIVDGKALENNTVVVGNDTIGIHKYILDGEKGAEGIDNTANVNDTVYWKIKTDIPSRVETLKTYTIVDTMSKGLEYKDAEIYLDDKTKLEEGEGKDYTVSSEGLDVTFTLNPKSLTNATQVIVYFNTILTSEAPLATDIPNTSKLIYTNNVGTDYTFEKQSETPTVHTGGYLFKKVADNNPLKGVTFAIYASEEDAKNGTNPIQTQTTGEDGVVFFKGIKYGSFSADEKGKATNGVENGSTEYWIMETSAPEGYIPLSAPFKVEINNKSHLEGTNKDVVNNRYPELPQTGATGTILLLAIAGAMVAVGTVMLVYRKKSRK